MLGFFMYNSGTGDDVCIDKCPTYMYGNETTRTCECILTHRAHASVVCISHCPSCSTGTGCQKCDAPYFIDTLSEGVNQCVNPCRVGYYNDPNDYCERSSSLL